MTAKPTPERLLNEHEAAEKLGLSVKTLQDWRFRRKEPRYVRLGRAIRYRPQDLDAFIDKNMIQL